jgi:hypothetical protein
MHTVNAGRNPDLKRPRFADDGLSLCVRAKDNYEKAFPIP